MLRKQLPIGVDDFRELIENDFYFVDKSLLVKDVIDRGSKCTLLPRPRRFGKTLNLSMLRHFFEKSDEDTSVLFHKLAIWRQGEKNIHEQGKYPVVFVTFKDVKSTNWDHCLRKLQDVVRSEFTRHYYLLESEVLKTNESLY